MRKYMIWSSVDPKTCQYCWMWLPIVPDLLTASYFINLFILSFLTDVIYMREKASDVFFHIMLKLQQIRWSPKRKGRQWRATQEAARGARQQCSLGSSGDAYRQPIYSRMKLAWNISGQTPSATPACNIGRSCLWREGRRTTVCVRCLLLRLITNVFIRCLYYLYMWLNEPLSSDTFNHYSAPFTFTMYSYSHKPLAAHEHSR